MGNLQVRFLEGWAPAMAPGYSTKWLLLPENALHLKAELPRPFSYLAAFQIPLAHKAVRR
jgi:hypothetical protein